MFEARTTLTKCTSFCISAGACAYVCLDIHAYLDIHDVCGCMIVQMQHIVIHTLSTKHGGRRGQICNNCAYAYLMDTCVALQ